MHMRTRTADGPPAEQSLEDYKRQTGKRRRGSPSIDGRTQIGDRTPRPLGDDGRASVDGMKGRGDVLAGRGRPAK